MKTLHLNLKRKWFDMILSGEKLEEYRDCSEYWNNRFLKGFSIRQDYDTVTFSNGYAKDRDQFVIKLMGINVGSGKVAWGANSDKRYYILYLGKIINEKQAQLPKI